MKRWRVVASFRSRTLVGHGFPPGDTENRYLIHKMDGRAGIVGRQDLFFKVRGV